MIALIPSPTTGVWHLGPIPVRAYALCILTGIVLAVWLTQRRLEDRGGRPGQALDVATWAVPFGMVGGRLYHVVTTPEPYFGAGGDPWRAFAVWEGGLGIWGAVALGAVGAWIGCRRAGVRFADFADAAFPGVAFAQALGRWGNWFNNELYGRRTDVPWGLQIHEWDQAAGHAVRGADGQAVVLGTFQPTFLYESLFCVALGALLLLVDARRHPARGVVTGLYIAGYPLGRVVVELLRSDPAHRILGLRLNVWTCLLVFLLGVTILIRASRHARQDEETTPVCVSDSETRSPTS